ncbi:MAG: RluA family pseudouridine synthase [Phycisphaerae bacterium]|nr:RluA family pseudouridine synthase [Phycisphaerae bacterium]MDW8260988.1 RluA family pseudouridine synthase [Phycisphaerales bacterium]
MTILDHLRLQMPRASRSTLRGMLRDGRIRVNGRLIQSLGEPLQPGDRVSILPRRPGRSRLARELPFPVVFEDEHLIVIHKPPGLLTSSGLRDRRPTAIGILRAHYRSQAPRVRIGLVHRLDADASGLLVFSKTARARNALKAQFLQHAVGREYLALVEGIPRPESGRIETLLVERADGTVTVTTDRRAGKPAVSHYQVVKSVGGRSVVRIRLETGRKHQIRVHLAHRGWPIVNDRLYHPDPGKGELALTAVALEISHPRTGRRMQWRIDPVFHI